MTSLILGAGTFAIVLGFAVAYLMRQRQFSYSRHVWIFTPLYVGSVSVLILLTPESVTYLSHQSGVILLGFVVLLYVLFEHVWSLRVNPAKAFGYQSIPDSFKSILRLDARAAVSKTSEIFLQQVCALLIILGLYEIGFSIGLISVLFVVVVFILHLPSPKWFGKFYGNYFLWMSTFLAPLIPWLILSFSIGFYLSVSLHIFMYIVLYSFAFWFRTKQS